MKKSLLALAALTAFAGAASAQSSVTLFGIVDVAARSVDNGDRLLSLSQDGNASSRLGFRGVEDLGGGLRAGFWLEGALSADTGGAAYNFQRRSTVSLLGGFGELRLGRDYTPTFWNHTVFDPFGTNGVGSQTNLMTTQLQIPGGANAAQIAAANKASTILGSGAGTLVRANNTIGYFLPAMGGLYGQFMVAAGESPTGNSGNKYMGFRLGYGAGPLNAAFAYGTTSDLVVGSPAVEADDLKAFNLGASYNLGFMTAMAQYHSYKQGDNKQTNYLLGANVPMGPGTFKASYGKVDLDDGTDSAGASQIAVGYVYDLSKRTALYTHFAKVSNDNGLTFVTGGTTGSSIANTGEGSTGFEFGVRHSF